MAGATISQIKVGNNTYDICDVTARDNLQTLENTFQQKIESLYPVGSIYLSIIDTSPATLFGFGTWQALTAGYALWTSTTTSDYGNTAAATNTGSTTLTAAQSGVPAHSHTATDAGHTHGAPRTSAGHDMANYWGGYSSSSSNAGFINSSNTSASGFTPRGNGQTTGSGKASITVSDNTAKNATSGHTHTASTPARIYIHAWKRTA